ncbi:MAG: hypothetical protein UT55_C0037G0004 [Candidatus Peregrinibacteria bacterium GW2011_GWE2_39_6]|nr:MAG: hypothetical protein UT36_C0003G0051 [Candidatus Peregrinibacteria bacterium GW2011_GWF2_39_17]KKR25585.1 MAG: hypothetical protein UT55_C0037G0004 [Candidatus Peregrinibacteria bacterium GW2011_GWE2_39_6]HCW31986.1 hypothetical protein [Candidatus Peregrinibacteria bacterium]
MGITNILLTLLLIGLGIVLYQLLLKPKNDSNDFRNIEENAKLKADLSHRDKQLGEIISNLQTEKTLKDELAGKNKQLFAEKTSLKAENESLLKDRERLSKEVTRFQSDEARMAKELEQKIQKLDEAKNALDDEKRRVRKEDEERDQKEKETRDRIWAEHENNVKNQLVELCKLPQYGFTTFDNKNLPDGFGGKFKPDFMIEFLGQYVIFDAKCSKSDNLQNYFANTAVKSTVEKINNDPRIYPMVFLVIPGEAIMSLTKTYFYEKGYEVFVISPDAMAVVLATFKKISSYELAEQMDPRDRENIVSLIAEFDHHINMRNALDLLSAQSGVSVLEKANTLRSDIKDDINFKKGKMRLQQFSPTDVKTLMLQTRNQQGVIDKLTSPRAQISKIDVESLKSIVE